MTGFIDVPRIGGLVAIIATTLLAASSAAVADAHPGKAIYQEHCVRCHGENGAGTADQPDPLVGDRSINQLAASIDETMPEDDPSRVDAEAARQVAEYIHGAFYSAVARDRNRPARVEPCRLTMRQYQNTVADLLGRFRGGRPGVDDSRGLKAEYFRGRSFDRREGLVYERVDPQVDFDFGLEGPEPEQFEPNRFAIRWTGSIVPPETGVYEFVVRSAQAVKLSVNSDWDEPSLIDAMVTSAGVDEYRGSLFLLGGRAYPLRLEFSKATQGVEKDGDRDPNPASIRLLWKPPHGVLETLPERCLIPHGCDRSYVVQTPFPPDDKSIGYERGTSISQEWFAAANAASIEVADMVLDHVEQLARVKRDAGDRPEKIRRFATTFAERAFRRPLSDDLREVVIDRAFDEAPDLDTGLKRSILLTINSPRFLCRGIDDAGDADPFETAARLSFGLWDSIPDDALWKAAERKKLSTVHQVRAQAERMVWDRRTRAKVRDFLFSWLRVDLAPELSKDRSLYPEFAPEIAADLRTSMELFLDDVVWRSGDFRRLFTDDEVFINGRLAPLYGADLPADAPFRRIRLDEGSRGGLISHPYMMSVLSYAGVTSPIHRGVFLARSVMGNTLRPPVEAVAPIAPEQHPDLTTRERVALQTRAVACQTCHTMINPLGFALEEFDAIGRRRLSEGSGPAQKPIDPTGSYLPREGQQASFRGARELAAYIATSPDAGEAFVQNLFHALVKQPVRAWGPETLENLRAGFEKSGFDIRRLLVDIMTVAALPPKVDVAQANDKENPR
jgi:hypothetical protein